MESLKGAINRGVSITLYSNMYGQGSQSLDVSLDEIKRLKEIGCNAFGDNNNHSKCVLSEKEGILFTANVDGISGMTNGFEVGCILSDKERESAVNHILTLISKTNNSKSN
jgi:hypothetical protein